MKKFSKLIPIICILVTTILSILFLDVRESKNYFQFKNQEKDFITLKYSDTVKIDNRKIKEILNLIHKYHLTLEKSNLSFEEEDRTDIYLSVSSKEELLQLVQKNLKVEKINGQTSDADAFVSTRKTNHKNQIGYIPDFLENNYYNYYTFEHLMNQHGNLYGEYVVYYDNYEDFSNFTIDLKNMLGQDVKSYSTFHNSQNYILIFIFASVFILMLFYFIFQIYESYYHSKKIACMKLLGIGKWKISNLMIKKRMKIYCIVLLTIMLLILFFAKNIDLYKIGFLMFTNIFLLICTYLINFICVQIILKEYQTSSILKHQNIAVKISKTSSKLKVITIILLVISVSFLFQNVSSLFNKMKVYQNSKELLNYGILYDFNADSEDIYQYQKHVDLYKRIVHDKKIHTFYTEFSKYYDKTEEEQKLVDEWYQEGKDFEYGSVDRNYLKKENIVVYDLNHQTIDIDKIEGVFFLFPKSKIKKIEQFQKFYETDSKSDYEKYGIHNQFKAYIYDDKKINTYRLDLKLKYVDSPIIRVIDESVSLSYIETSRGLSVFGNGLTTGLKIELNNNKNETFQNILKHISGSELTDLLGIHNFLTFQDYFSDEIQTARLISIVVTIAFILVLIVYIIISIQVISLYVKSENQKVIVKYLLGYQKTDIFKEMIDKNLKYNMIAFLITALILNFVHQFHLLLYMISISTFIVIDFIILFIAIKNYNFSKLYLQLKGGNYD